MQILERAVLNVLDNAIKFAAVGTMIHVRLGNGTRLKFAAELPTAGVEATSTKGPLAMMEHHRSTPPGAPRRERRTAPQTARLRDRRGTPRGAPAGLRWSAWSS